MEPLRTHDIVLADGTFRVLLTPQRRVVAVIDAPHTSLGSLHVALLIDRTPFLAPDIAPLVHSYDTAGLFDGIAHAVSNVAKGVAHAAEGAFNVASKAATTVARPAFDVLKTAASHGASLVAHATPFLPDSARRQLESASHVIMRARLGDMTAQQFIKNIASAAKAGVSSAMKIGDTLLDASKTIAKVADVPVHLASLVPGLGGVARSISPLQAWNHMATAIQKGDFKQVADIARNQLSMAQGVLSLVPGVGSGISAAISAGLALLQGGGPLDIAIRTAYGAIPIPPGIRQLTDMVLDAVLSIAHSGNVTDVALQVARDKVPAGLPRDVFDTLIHLVVHKHPLQRGVEGLADHFVRQYAPLGAGLHVDTAMQHAAAHILPAAGHRLVQPLHLHT